jgi:CRP-like cAMP-binding protein
VAQGDLGRLAGISRESTCKALRSFQSQGLLDYRGRRLRILRPDVLERIRCTGRMARGPRDA